MKRSTFVVGSVMIIVGFILYQFGWSAELHKETMLGIWLDEFTTIIGARSAILAVFFQFFGGLLSILGLIICISGVVASKEIQYRNQKTRRRKQTLNCKFCGAELEKDSMFCSECKKSQS